MIHSKIILIASVLLLFTTACNNTSTDGRDENNTVELGGNKEILKETNKESVVQNNNISDEVVVEVVTVYLRIKDALIESNAESASTEAAKMQSVIGDEKEEMLEEISEDANDIAQSEDVEEQRTAFQELSDNLYDLLKTHGTKDTELYRQFCPMAMNNEGAYWLSAEKEIRNPYFGDRMLKCGSVKETLN